MLPKLLAAVMVAICLFVGDNALAQKSARISVAPDGTTTIVYRQSGVRRVTTYYGPYYRSSYGYRAGWHLGHWTTRLQHYTRTWSETRPAWKPSK